MPTIEQTKAFIKQAFGSKTDKGGEPYYLHPIAVMESLPETLKPIDIEVKLAALLHDVVDDCGVSISQLEARGYTKRTLDIVQLLSKRRPDSTIDNRPYKEQIDSIINSGNEDAILVKYADMFQNTRPDRLAKSGARHRLEAKYKEPMQELAEAVYMLGYIAEPVVVHQKITKQPPADTNDRGQPPLNDKMPPRSRRDIAKARTRNRSDERRAKYRVERALDAATSIGLNYPAVPAKLAAASLDEDRKIRQQAQDVLVNRTLRAALMNLYWQCAERGKLVQTEIMMHYHIQELGRKYGDTHSEHTIPLYNKDNESCATPNEATMAIEQLFDNEYDRVEAFNALARLNGVDIKLRTSGPKTDDSIHEKAKRRYRGDVTRVRDEARIMVISRDPLTLQFIAGNFDYVCTGAKEDDSPEPVTLEDWEMIKIGVLKRASLTKILGIPSEVQYVPLEQQEIAGKIVHKIYKIVRGWDACRDEPDGLVRQEKMAKVAMRYNRMARLINELFTTESHVRGLSAQPSHAISWKMANQAFAEIDQGSDVPQRANVGTRLSQQTYTPVARVFNSDDDMQSFRRYLRRGSPVLAASLKKHVLPLPIIPEHGEYNTATIEKDLALLNGIRQIALTYYMQQGLPEMRALWRDKARELNGANPNSIPEDFIQSVCRGRNGAHPIAHGNATAYEKTRVR